MRQLALSVLLALALAPAAAAKELQSATLCGATGCRTLDDAVALRSIPRGGESTRPLGPPAPFYRLRLVYRGYGHRSELHYVPAANALAEAPASESGEVRYLPIPDGIPMRALRALAAGIEPFPRPRITTVTVGPRTVTGADAQTYARLFALTPTRELRVQSASWMLIDLDSARPSPWTDSMVEFTYSPEDDALLRGWRRMEVPGELAADLEAGRALERGDPGLPWSTLALSALGAIALAGLTRKRTVLPSVLSRWPQGERPRLRGS